VPKLLLFTPCERAIVDETNNLSLISVLEIITLEQIPGVSFPPHFAIPLNWAAVSLWKREAHDADDAHFQQRFRIVYCGTPETVVVENVSDFVFGDKANHRLTGKMNAFQIVGFGTYELRAELKTATSEWLHVATFPISVLLNPIRPSSSS
jgi:hypothetical protein